MDWDSDSFETPVIAAPTINNNWDDEDVEETVKDSWEDEEEDKKKEEQKKQSSQSKKPKNRLEEKLEERNRRELEKMKQKKLSQLEEDIDDDNLTPDELEALKKLRMQKLQEESDFELAKEMLGLSEDSSNERLSSKELLTLLEKLNLKTKQDFTELKDVLSQTILVFKKSEYFPQFVEELVRDLSVPLSNPDLKKLKLTIDNMVNEKIRIEKLEKNKKSKGKGKARLKMEGSDLVYDEYSAYTIDDDYDDFM